MRKKPLATAVAAAVKPTEEVAVAAPAQQGNPAADALAFIAQYVKEKVSKEDPSIRAVMDPTMEQQFAIVQKALGLN
jgi:hypothetical protein